MGGSSQATPSPPFGVPGALPDFGGGIGPFPALGGIGTFPAFGGTGTFPAFGGIGTFPASGRGAPELTEVRPQLVLLCK